MDFVSLLRQMHGTLVGVGTVFVIVTFVAVLVLWALRREPHVLQVGCFVYGLVLIGLFAILGGSAILIYADNATPRNAESRAGIYKQANDNRQPTKE